MAESYNSENTWAKFEVKRKNGEVLKLRIQDLPSDKKDAAIEFLIKYSMPEEAIPKAAGISKCEIAIQEYQEGLKRLLEDSDTHSIICCKEDDTVGEILGLSFMELSKNTDSVEDFLQEVLLKSEPIKKMFDIIKVLEDCAGVKTFENYYNDLGIAVHPDYRGLGLAQEFLRVRKLICIEHSVPMTSAWMTALATQKAADRHNWKTSAEISLEELDKRTGLTFEKTVPSFKLMYTTVD